MKKLNTILLIDDDETTNFFHRSLLQFVDSATHVIGVKNGEEALKVLANDTIRMNIDLILLDINMPVMDGFEFVKEWEKLPQSINGAPIMMVTTSDHFQDRERAAGFPSIQAYYNKPLTIEVVRNIHFLHFSALAS